MLLKRIRKSLTVRIFFITTLILLAAGIVTFGLLALVTPDSYSVVINDEMSDKVDELASLLENTELEESGSLIDDFIRDTGAEASVTDEKGNPVDTGSLLEYKDDNISEETSSVLSIVVCFSDQNEYYILNVKPRSVSENMIVKAMVKVSPWLLLIILAFSLLCSFVYSRYITKPIVRLETIAGKMAEQDFDWTCDESRQDEIGRLGRSLNTMSQNLSGALNDLKASNAALRGEVEQERELDRQRMAFFSAASHELKTPVTILKGHITGMLDGIDMYQDRDKYLARCLQVTGRMENLINEILSVSGIERGVLEQGDEVFDISGIAEEQTGLISELAEQKEIIIEKNLTLSLSIKGNRSLISKAVGNLLSNAVHYSPEGEHIKIFSKKENDNTMLTIENTGVHISEDALPHVFEAFYREEQSRNRRTGGSGLGLYLVRMIMEKHGGECRIENTREGVRASLVFPIFT